MGSPPHTTHCITDNSRTMGNTAARHRLKAKDFAYISKNTAFLSRDIVADYYTDLVTRCSDGKMEAQEFKKIFRLAFPERPEDKLDLLTAKVANAEKTDGKIPLHTIGMLLYLFCEGKTEDNLGQMFNLFDEDGNGSINVEELLNMMAFFIEIGADAGSVDLATVMAEMFQGGDRNSDDKLTKAEFIQGMMGHPIIAEILKVKTIDALLATF